MPYCSGLPTGLSSLETMKAMGKILNRRMQMCPAHTGQTEHLLGKESHTGLESCLKAAILEQNKKPIEYTDTQELSIFFYPGHVLLWGVAYTGGVRDHTWGNPALKEWKGES